HEAAKHAANVTKIKEKWAVDTKLICEILDEFKEKMTALGPRFDLTEIAPPRGQAAASKITGGFGGKPVSIVITVDEGGTASGRTEVLRGPCSIAVLTADKEAYKNFILDLLGVD